MQHIHNTLILFQSITRIITSPNIPLPTAMKNNKNDSYNVKYVFNYPKTHEPKLRQSLCGQQLKPEQMLRTKYVRSGLSRIVKSTLLLFIAPIFIKRASAESTLLKGGKKKTSKSAIPQSPGHFPPVGRNGAFILPMLSPFNLTTAICLRGGDKERLVAVHLFFLRKIREKSVLEFKYSNKIINVASYFLNRMDKCCFCLLSFFLQPIDMEI